MMYAYILKCFVFFFLYNFRVSGYCQGLNQYGVGFMQVRSKDLFSFFCMLIHNFPSPIFEEIVCSPMYIYGDFVGNQVV